MHNINVLHSSDWHLGRSLLNKRRLAEQAKFLDWLLQIIDEKKVDVLLLAGDIFDNTSPSNAAQELYYNFLSRLNNSRCRHTVITAGNHDSPSFLMAPQKLLKNMNIHVVPLASNPEEELIILKDKEGQVELMVAAVPYLRDRELRLSEAGESYEAKEQKTQEAIHQHYQVMYEAAAKKRKDFGDIPIILMGHLFVVGGKVIEGDGVRNFSVGSLSGVSADIFHPEADYVALGHLHSPQLVNKNENIRYSGSPLHMSFSELGGRKSVSLLKFKGREKELEFIEVPIFQKILKIKGDLATLEEKLIALVKLDESIWLELEYTGQDFCPNLIDLLEEKVKGSLLELLIIKDSRISEDFEEEEVPELEDMNPLSVFASYLSMKQIPEKQQLELTQSYEEILKALEEEISV